MEISKNTGLAKGKRHSYTGFILIAARAAFSRQEQKMNKLIIAAGLGAVVTLATAQNRPALEEIRISGALSRIELPTELRNVWPDEFDQVKGTYYLSNGKTMQLSMWGNRMYAKIDGMPRSQLVAASPYVFVGLKRDLRIRITNPDDSGPIKAEILLSTPAPAQASIQGSLTRLVASR